MARGDGDAVIGCGIVVLFALWIGFLLWAGIKIVLWLTTQEL